MPIVSGRDVLTQAQLGTGKTGAFCIGILQRVDTSIQACQVRQCLMWLGLIVPDGPLRPVLQALVLVATRESAEQVTDTLAAIGKHTGVSMRACLGSSAVRLDIAALRAGVHVAIGTPGRILDLIHRGVLDVSQLKMMVMDAADQMTDRGFKDALVDIHASGVPATLQVVLFTSSMSAEVQEIANKVMLEPVVVSVRRRDTSLDGTAQYYAEVADEDKLETLCRVMDDLDVMQAVAFVSKKKQVDWLVEQVGTCGVSAAALHAEMDTKERHDVLVAFQEGKYRLLVTSDLLARGFEAEHVKICFNFDVPATKEMYVHRVGRPAGKPGVAVNIVTTEERAFLADVEAEYHVTVKPVADNMDAIREQLAN